VTRKALAVAAALAIVAACGRSEQVTAAQMMQQDLSEMRKAIRDFRADKKRHPKTLNELVQAHYLRMIPKDPVTRASDWRVVTEEPVRVDDFTRAVPPPAAGGIVDVHSAAAGTDANGKPWSEY
jgi:general secretion pathway protein G